MEGPDQHDSPRPDRGEEEVEEEKERHTSEEDEESQDRAKGGKKPVHFFHSDLNAVRLEVFKLWGRTSESPYNLTSLDRG